MRKVSLFSALALAAAAALLSCGGQNTPLDAETRTRIDSIANAEIARSQVVNDSLCRAAEAALLPQLVDSIARLRREQIRRQLKTVPR